MINIGIVGYGNLGRGVEIALKANEDLNLVAVFTRRNPETLEILTKGVRVESIDNILNYKDKIDVMILCGGSANDLPIQSPMIGKNFNFVDSYDTHALINKHFENVDKETKHGQKVGIISIGWDPGMFSLNRLYANAILPNSSTYTFWGDGVSQGHSDAIRKISGVKYAVQYTRPIKTAVEKVKKGENPEFTAKEKHLRDCYVVINDGYCKEEIKEKIITMPNYFADYTTSVTFISEDEYKKEHLKMPHGGMVITSGVTSSNNKHLIEYNLKLDSNPEFTAATLVAFARACYKLSIEKNYGAKTIFDIPAAYLLNKSADEIRKELL